METHQHRAACQHVYRHWSLGTQLDALAPLLPDTACAHRFVLGAAPQADRRPLDLAAHSRRIFKNGMLAEQGVGSNVLGDPRIALTWLANELPRHGMVLKAGQVLITGTC